MKLTVRQAWLLLYLRDHDRTGATLKEMCRDSPVDEIQTADYHERFPNLTDVEVRSIEYGTATTSIKRLVKAGLVRREPEGRPEPGRARLHFLTVEGFQMAMSISAPRL